MCLSVCVGNKKGQEQKDGQHKHTSTHPQTRGGQAYFLCHIKNSALWCIKKKVRMCFVLDFFFQFFVVVAERLAHASEVGGDWRAKGWGLEGVNE